jgi:hypothetical protein
MIASLAMYFYESLYLLNPIFGAVSTGNRVDVAPR